MTSNGAWRALIVAVITFALVASIVPIGMGQINGEENLGAPAPEPDYVIGGDLIVSFDEEANLNDALHPSVAVPPSGATNDGLIFVVWDELDELSGYREIHFSMSDDGGVSWSQDHEDFVISDNRKDKANNGDAVNPTITVDHNGWLHVVWSEQMAVDDTWEVMYKYSKDDGETWIGDGLDDMMISWRYGDRQDADVMSTPEIKFGVFGGKAPEILHVVWSERDDKFTQEEVRYSRSFDFGNTWTSIDNKGDDYISKPDDIFASDPSIIITGGEANNIHVTWTQVDKQGFGLDEIWYSTSDSYGDKGTWREEEPVSAGLDDNMDARDASICGDIDGRLYTVWKQYPHEKDKASPPEIFYSFYDGEKWSGVEQDTSISFEDSYEPFAPKISMSDKIVQVVWTEIDEKSPLGTQEIHTSWSEDPMDPQSWTGSKEDIVLSNGDDWGPAHANNVSFVYGNLKGEWKPIFVWDELNDGPTGKGLDRAEGNYEIHTEPVEWTLSVSTVGSGSVTKDPNQPTYINGTSVSLTANPGVGWDFDHWELDISGSSNPYNLLMDDDKSVRAVFVQDLWKDLYASAVSGPASCTEGDSISISRTYQNQGTDASGTFRYGLYLSTDNSITTDDTLLYSYQHPGLAAGASSTLSIGVSLPWGTTGTFYYGLLVDDLYQVVETNEGNNDIASAATVTISATQFTLGTSVVGSGTVTKNPNQATYGRGDSVTLTANPSFGWEFDQWGGDLVSFANPDSITMDSNKAVIAYFTQITHDIALVTGWNLVSIPLEQADTSIATVLSSISGNYYAVKYYDATDQNDPWKTYRVGATTNDLTDIDHTMAFWIDIKAPCTFSPTGEYAASTSINIYTGWNFIGYPSANKSTTLADALTGVSYDMIEGYDGDDPYLLRTMAGTEMMMPGTGYWIHATSDSLWTIHW